ncbi:MAG: S-formylglutathione hydrolase [Verrucomicrobiaceae bacterium]|nr:S-formylglutathione hydrolase [Verrucomicrobiaceae bacterium]
MAVDSLKIISSNKSFGGVQYRLQHRSSVLKSDMVVSLYLPPAAADNKAVPVLYWLSGLTCNDQNFVTKAGAQRYAAQHNVAIVAPDTSPRGDAIADDANWDLGQGAGFYLNATAAPWSVNFRMYDYIVDELPALIESQFNLDGARRGIFGHSMGGHGALTIALKNPDRYRSLSAFSPICAPTKCPWGEKAFGAYLGEDRTAWEQHDSSALLAQKKLPYPILIDQGEADEFLKNQLMPDRLKQAATQSGQALTLRYQPGYDHSYFFIATFIEDHIRFHTEQLAAS